MPTRHHILMYYPFLSLWLVLRVSVKIVCKILNFHNRVLHSQNDGFLFYHFLQTAKNFRFIIQVYVPSATAPGHTCNGRFILV
jgi:hypothetical protein